MSDMDPYTGHDHNATNSQVLEHKIDETNPSPMVLAASMSFQTTEDLNKDSAELLALIERIKTEQGGEILGDYPQPQSQPQPKEDESLNQIAGGQEDNESQADEEQVDGDGEVLDDNLDLDDLLNDMFVAGEISDMTNVRGVKVQTLTIDIDRIKTLLSVTDNEFINQTHGKFLVNMLNIAMRRKENDTAGKTFLNIKGLPNWIVPVITGEWTSVDRAYSTVKKESFQPTTTPNGCNIKLDPVTPAIYTGYGMDTDKQTEMPGSWVKARSDHTVTVINRSSDKHVKQLKIPGNSYTSNVKLTEEALAFIASKRSNKKSSTFIRMLTNPNAISSIDMDLVGTERSVSIMGFVIRDPDSTARPISAAEFQQNFIPINCLSDPAALEKTLDKHIPSVSTILEQAELKSSSLQTYISLLSYYNYERNDLTSKDWALIGKLIKRNLSKSSTDKWVESHGQQISTLTRVTNLEPKIMQPADNGKYQYSAELDDYMQETNAESVVLPSVTTATSVKPTVNTPRYNSIAIDSVHGTLFRSDNGQFYTGQEYKQHLQYQLYERLLSNLERVKSRGIASETLKFILADLERVRWQSNKGILDSLKIKLSTNNMVSSAILNVLTEFDRRELDGQIRFIRHMDMLIKKGVVRLDPFTKKYYIVQSNERVCCQHEMEELKDQSIQEFIGTEGKCKYCGVQLIHEDDPDDYGQTQFMTTRDMYTAQGEEIPDTDPDFATLDYFIGQALKTLEAKLQEREIVLSSANVEQIKTDTIEYIKKHNPVAAKPYGPLINERPNAQTTDLRLAIMYNLPFSRTPSATNERVFLKKSSKSDALVATTGFSLALAYFRENEQDSTNKGIAELYPKFKNDKHILELLQNNDTAFPALHNLLVMNRLAYCYGVLIAHLTLTVNIDYSNTVSLTDLVTDALIFDICDSHTSLMNITLNRHIANLRTGDKATQVKIMPHFDAYIKLFTAPFNMNLYKLGFTSNSMGVARPAEDRSLAAFQETFEQLHRQNIALYDAIVVKAEKTGGFAEFEARRSMVFPYTGVAPRQPKEIRSVSDAIDCWTINAVRGSEYGQNLWNQYGNINKNIGSLDIAEQLSTDSVGMETLQASACSSKVLMNGPILDEQPDEALAKYIANEQNLMDLHSAYSADLSAIDQELCEIQMAKPTYNKSQQTNLVYHPSAGATAQTKYGVMLKLVDTDYSLRKEYTEDVFLNNIHVLVKYASMAGYASALDGAIFNRGTGISVKRMNFLTNDIAANNQSSVNTIVNNELQILQNHRKYTVALAEDSMKEPDNLDEIPGFNEDFPKLVKTEAELMQARDTTINKRRIFRLQNNGSSINNLIGWLNSDLSEDTIANLIKIAEESEEKNLKAGARYMIEKEVASGEGYIMLDLIKLKMKFREQIGRMQLDEYASAVPQIYKMSFLEYQMVMQMLDMPDMITLANFRNMLFASIRLDIIMHVKHLRTKKFGKRKLSEEDLSDIHSFISTKEGQEFTTLMTELLNALATINMDPNADSINRLYEARQMERITLTMAARAKTKTGFEMGPTGNIEETLGERVQDENDPLTGEDEADGDNDGQRDEGPVTYDDDYEEDGFDEEADVNVFQGETED